MVYQRRAVKSATSLLYLTDCKLYRCDSVLNSQCGTLLQQTATIVVDNFGILRTCVPVGTALHDSLCTSCNWAKWKSILLWWKYGEKFTTYQYNCAGINRATNFLALLFIATVHHSPAKPNIASPIEMVNYRIS